jgi:hypothetical protein
MENKNIYIVPTDKKSRLQKNHHSKLFLSESFKKYHDCTSQHIYITSEDKIKDCYVLNTHNNSVYPLKGYYGIQPMVKKNHLNNRPKTYRKRRTGNV